MPSQAMLCKMPYNVRLSTSPFNRPTLCIIPNWCCIELWNILVPPGLYVRILVIHTWMCLTTESYVDTNITLLEFPGRLASGKALILLPVANIRCPTSLAVKDFAPKYAIISIYWYGAERDDNISEMKRAYLADVRCEINYSATLTSRLITM